MLYRTCTTITSVDLHITESVVLKIGICGLWYKYSLSMSTDNIYTEIQVFFLNISFSFAQNATKFGIGNELLMTLYMAMIKVLTGVKLHNTRRRHKRGVYFNNTSSDFALEGSLSIFEYFLLSVLCEW